MTNFKIEFSNPWLLLLLIPAIALTLFPYFRLAKQYRRTRNRVISVVLHLVVMLLSITLISGISFSYELPNKENELLLLVDASFSNRDAQDERETFIEQVINDCGKNYRVGVVKFGYTQTYAAKLSNDSSQVYRDYRNSEDPDTSATDVASALRYASELFQRPESAKIVLISDGIETDGNAFSVIRGIAAEGIKVDVVPLANPSHDEVQFIGVETPDRNVIAGESVTLRITVRTNRNARGNKATVKLFDTLIGGEENEAPAAREGEQEDGFSASTAFELGAGLQTVELNYVFEKAGMHELKFSLSVTDNIGDTVVENNKYFSYLNMQVFDKVLMIENDAEEAKALKEMMEGEEFKYKVTVLNASKDAEAIPQTLEEISQYEQVLLVNIANKDMKPEFFELMDVYVSEYGGGLFTVGGETDKNENGDVVPHAYLRSDMQGTLYQQMLPVRVVDYTPPVAVMIVIDTSGSMSSSVPQAKRGAEQVLDALTSRDFCGVMTFSDSASETVQVLPASQKEKIREIIRNIPEDGSGGTVFADAIRKAGAALSTVEVSRKHIIMVSDGVVDDEDEKVYTDFIRANREKGITLSIVGVYVSGGYAEKMKQACELGGGNFYNVSTVGSELSDKIYEDLIDNAVTEIEYNKEFKLRINEYTPVVSGVTQPELNKLPFKGYYGTSLKEGASAPLMGEYVPVYAEWKYGKGNVGSFMSNLTVEWSGEFLTSPTGKRLMKNIFSGLFPTEKINLSDIELSFKEDNYSTQMNVYASLGEGDRVEVSVTPYSAEAKNYYAGTSVPVTASDGFTRFTIVITCPGLYEVTVQKKNAAGEVVSARSVLRTFSYSQEYNLFPEDEPIGEDYLAQIAENGKGKVITDSLEVFDSFEKTIKKTADPRLAFLIIAIVLFLLDIAVRKFKFKWIHEMIRDRKARAEIERSASRRKS